jgi:hypothetical protein
MVCELLVHEHRWFQWRDIHHLKGAFTDDTYLRARGKKSKMSRSGHHPSESRSYSIHPQLIAARVRYGENRSVCTRDMVR